MDNVEEPYIERGYKGNTNLKRRDEAIDWTPELVQEYVKCAQDPIYFIEKYMKIISINKGLVNFTLYDYQKTMIKSMTNNRYSVIATARQAGKSTTTCGFILWYIIFHADKTVALLANKGDTAREILGRIQLAYQHLPKWLQQGVVEWNKGSFVLENNSRVVAAATSSDAIRGYSINLLFIDEAAFIDTWDEFFTSVYPTISSGDESKIVLVSTPNGLNHFHKIWSDANQGKNQYNPTQVMWYDVPGRDEKWKEDTIAAMSGDVEKFNQEYCVEFLGSSGTLIAGYKLKQLASIHPIVEKEGLKQYKEARKDRTYTCLVDTSRGKGLDYSAFQIIDVTEMPYEQVCVFRDNNITPTDYCTVIHRITKIYNDAAVLVEINDIGGQVADLLYYEFDMDNLLITQNDGRAGKRISSGFGGGAYDRGVRTTKTVKSVGCSIMKLLIEQDQLILHDHETIYELSTFSRRGKSYEAEPGKHDDLVMCLVLFSWLSDQKYFRELTDINTLKKIRDREEEEIEEELTPFGFVQLATDGPDLDLPKDENWIWAGEFDQYKN